MPPRVSQSGSSRSGRGGPPPRGSSPSGRGRGAPTRGGAPSIRGGASSAGAVLPSTSDHITTIGVKRTAFGRAGRPLTVFTNHFEVTIPENVIMHYDVISPSEKVLPARLNMDIITTLQQVVAPEIFTPRAVYDGRKNLFAIRELPFGGKDSAEFEVPLAGAKPPANPNRAPKPYKVRLTKVAEINPEVLARFLIGKQSHDNSVITAITALNVVIRMEPTIHYPFNIRSFFTDRETKDIGAGLVLWRGYFQSVRPGTGKMLINVDISTGTMYKPGRLLDLCLEAAGQKQPAALAPKRGLPEKARIRLQHFISGIRIQTLDVNGRPSGAARVVKKLSSAGASEVSFTMREGGTMTVAEYFHKTRNRPLQFPDVICAEVGSGALIPLELCYVPPGQIMRKQMPLDKTREVLEFATKKPGDRLASIRNGLGVLNYGQSEYVRHFGMHVTETQGPLKVAARVLAPPTLRYGRESRQPNIVPRDGQWNMVDKRFFRPATIKHWAVVVFEREGRFLMQHAQETIKGLIEAAREVGMKVEDVSPIIKFENGHRPPSVVLPEVGKEVHNRYKELPMLIVVVLPDGGSDIYSAVKHFGDVRAGVATQCLKSSKCMRAKKQYFSNVCLKINVKLGGINMIPEPSTVSVLTDPLNPTIVMGADVIHPAPGSEGRPSFTSLVANVDSDTAKYIADSRVQTSRKEMIEDLKEMSKHMLTMYMGYRASVEKKAKKEPSRIILYRDGVSEGQFKQVLEQELPQLQEACSELGIKPKITIVVVGKRHHVRFFPTNERDGDKSGNCPAGTVVDQEVAHPTEFDFYLQSHGGLLGTSRPAHYSVLYDENGFQPDDLQSLSFALCHVYARSTRSVSIPAPVYYADIVCSRAKNHYAPDSRLDFSEYGDSKQGSTSGDPLEPYKEGFKPLHPAMKKLMYFS
ncbi:argonaute-like protein [Punctularia strigosozonata HHB-11173 SS5]|uniref:argonaute-like protein n=1 Tax=Punctularia strigosozonata (strain HHB-11173) TaxID=741275 RepID=UPI0004416E94|nr:argonaute-like protein [Punctularia strigosozonata HHB-11173 SS5]EIN10450.1 argonaute-like protein [Punctularia strigosozonata HHB-11173 SS5]